MTGANDCREEIQPPPRADTVEDRAFWKALDAGSLSLAHCSCGACYARSQACFHCGASAATLRWAPASGEATLVSYVVFDKAYHPYFARRLPYVVAVVELTEGPRLVTNLVGPDGTPVNTAVLAAGMPLTLQLVTRGRQNIHQATITP